MKSNIILIGMPGSGKSSLGKLLAQAKDMAFVDTDDMIEKREHLPLQEILNQKGFAYFKQAEERAILSENCYHTVIATGGSAVLSEKAMAHLAENGRVVFLEVGYYDLLHRIHNMKTRGIAFAPGQGFLDIHVQREPLFRRWADVTVKINDDDHHTKEELVQRIIRALEN